jgi:hypothetical protein
MRRLVAFLIARPLIAVLLAALVVGVIALTQTHKQPTAVTERTEHVALSDAQQTQLGDQQYAKALRQDGANVVSSSVRTTRSGAWPRGSRSSPAATSPRFIGG